MTFKLNKKKISVIFIVFFLVLAGLSLKDIIKIFLKPKKVFLSMKNVDTAKEFIISEKGVLEFKDKTQKIIINNYKASLMFNSKKNKLHIFGTFTGELDKKLSSIIKSHDIDITLDLNQEKTFCPSKFSPLYPISIKRFAYFFPKKHLFKNKFWEGNFCNESIKCKYKIFDILKNKTVKYGFHCSGNIKNNKIVSFGTLIFDLNQKIFTKMNINLKTFSKDLSTTWILNEKSAL